MLKTHYKILERDVFTGRFRQIYETNDPNKQLLKAKFKFGGLKGKAKYKIVPFKVKHII
jgi:hypothetical protein